ncbi:MAG TPA: primosomal protein N' [Homoserinimonas sp.]|nr:primosomal protein N' [Homoserinimonas sp.]
MPGSAPIARVLIDSALPQLDRLFDYSIPEALAETAVPGVRVKVPLRSAGRVAEGFIVELTDSVEYSGTLSELDSVVSPVRVLTPEVYALARRLADRAAGSANDIVRLAVPKRQVRVEKAWLSADPETLAPVQAIGVPGYHADAFSAALTAGGRLAMDAIPRLVQLTDGSWVGHWAVALSALATQVVASGKSAILAVPDYRDQAQLQSALAEVLPPARVVRLDARQANPERYRDLLACLDGQPRVIVGNRSVVYAPAAELGLIALWDDSDPLHAEPLSPYVHTRDAALVRQEQQGGALVFLGHSRSTEVQRLVEHDWATEVRPERAYLPKVIPTAGQGADNPQAAAARIPSTAWQQARDALRTGPVLVQVARPGYAPRLACDSCGQSARCTVCEGPLGTKSARSTPACHWCGALAANWSCHNCGGARYRLVGQGSTRTAEDLGRAFPGVKVVVADGERPLLTVPGTPALVISTRGAEPVADGGYRGVLLLDGERMLAREALRVGEDCLRWWSNAAALAAPGAPVILVGVGGALATAMATWRLADYASSELADRRRLRFPPAVRVATVTGSADAVESAVAEAAAVPGVDALGPTAVDDGVRAIVRLEYAAGGQVAPILRSAVIRNATTRRKRVPPGEGRLPALPTLKVRFDDSEPFGN